MRVYGRSFFFSLFCSVSTFVFLVVILFSLRNNRTKINNSHVLCLIILSYNSYDIIVPRLFDRNRPIFQHSVSIRRVCKMKLLPDVRSRLKETNSVIYKTLRRMHIENSCAQKHRNRRFYLFYRFAHAYYTRQSLNFTAHDRDQHLRPKRNSLAISK